MKANIYIDSTLIGEADFYCADEGMGGICGELIPNENYENYKAQIQALSLTKGIANWEDYAFRIVTNDGSELTPQGGIGITDIALFNEIIVESAGNEAFVMERVKNGACK